MPKSGSVSIYYWNANHIALEIKEQEYDIEKGGYEVDEDNQPIVDKVFRALTHDSDSKDAFTSSLIPPTLKRILNDLFDSKCTKTPSIITNYWEDCSQYIRDNQLQLLKDLHNLAIAFYAFDDDDDLEEMGEEYEDEDVMLEGLDNLNDEIDLGFDLKTGVQRREDALSRASAHEPLSSLVNQLKKKSTPLEKKGLIIDFIDQLKNKKGLGICLTDESDEQTMFGKMPSKEWILPLGNSFVSKVDTTNQPINLFGLHAEGIKNGISKFDDNMASVNGRAENPYYKYYSRYHNCAGYSRYLLEEGGANIFCSTRDLEHYGISDPQKYEHYMAKIQLKLADINDKGNELIEKAGVKIVSLNSLTDNYLAEFKKGNEDYDKMPYNIRALLTTYNNELPDNISYLYKMELLVELVIKLHNKKIYSPDIVNALQKEIRRNYSINFDAKFKYNYSFCLKASAAISTACNNLQLLTTSLFLALYTMFSSFYKKNNTDPTNLYKERCNLIRDSEPNSPTSQLKCV